MLQSNFTFLWNARFLALLKLLQPDGLLCYPEARVIQDKSNSFVRTSSLLLIPLQQGLELTTFLLLFLLIPLQSRPGTQLLSPMLLHKSLSSPVKYPLGSSFSCSPRWQKEKGWRARLLALRGAPSLSAFFHLSSPFAVVVWSYPYVQD